MSKLVVVNNFVDIPPEEDICKHTNSTNIMFLGKMDYEPNVQAVTSFAKKIFQPLFEENKNLCFQIVGANPDQRVKALASHPGIVVTGFVDSVIPYFQNSALVVAPMRSGAGVQNKVIQAMAYGCCVLTTPIGAEGLTIDGHDILILDTVEEWKSSIRQLIANPISRKQIGNLARENVKANLSRQAIYSQFCNFMS